MGSGGGGSTRAAINRQMIEFADFILQQLPEQLGSGSGEGGGGGDKSSLQRYFEREINAVQNMLKMLRRDLAALKLVAEGEERSTNRTRDIQAALLKGEVPSIWLKYPVPPMSVNAWVTDFVMRANQLVEVFDQVEAGAKAGTAELPMAVWMGAFFMPGAFLTATQQTAAKALNSSMEMLKMVVDVIEEGDPEFTKGAVVGSQYLVKDTFIEAAAWKNGALALSDNMLQRLPTIRFTWLVDNPEAEAGRVELPIYLNSTRKQLISVALLKTPEDVKPGTWYQRGTCLQLWRA